MKITPHGFNAEAKTTVKNASRANPRSTHVTMNSSDFITRPSSSIFTTGLGGCEAAGLISRDSEKGFSVLLTHFAEMNANPLISGGMSSGHEYRQAIERRFEQNLVASSDNAKHVLITASEKSQAPQYMLEPLERFLSVPSELVHFHIEYGDNEKSHDLAFMINQNNTAVEYAALGREFGTISE